MRRALLLLTLPSLAACTEKPSPVPASRDAAPVVVLPSAAPRASAVPSAPPSSLVRPTATQVASGSALPSSEGGAPGGPCARTWGPAEMPFHGPAALAQRGSDIVVVYNAGGAPRAHTVPVPPALAPGAAPVVPPRPASFATAAWPACALGGAFTYCARGTAILAYRRGAEGAGGKKIADVRGATRLAAAPLGKDHAVVLFIDERATSEGKTRHAFGAVDDGTPVRVSEDGSGATVVDVAPRGDGALVVYVDARSSMTPIHARVARLRDGKLELDKDAVLAVGGSAERGLSAVVASTDRQAFALAPMPEGSSTFGLAVVKIGDPPKDDVPIVWSRYPNGMDPAPVAATTAGSPARILRARPLDATFNGPRVLELGHVDDSAGFHPDALLEPDTPMAEIAILADAQGSVWLLHGDATGTWLERRTCPR